MFLGSFENLYKYDFLVQNSTETCIYLGLDVRVSDCFVLCGLKMNDKAANDGWRTFAQGHFKKFKECILLITMLFLTMIITGWAKSKENSLTTSAQFTDKKHQCCLFRISRRKYQLYVELLKQSKTR